jgi:hypothetical protein
MGPVPKFLSGHRKLMAILGPFKVNRGYNAKASVFTCPQNQALTFQDLYVDYDIIKTNPGPYQLQGNASNQVVGMTFWSDPNNILSTNDANVIYYLYRSGTAIGDLRSAPFKTGADGQTLTVTSRIGALSLSGALGMFGQPQLYSFDSLNALLIGTGGSFSSTVPFKFTAYNANGVVLGGSPPPSDAIKVVNNFCFLGRNLSGTSTLSRVYWSNVGDPETWGASSYVDFRKNDGDMITALGSLGQDLIIFKNRSIGRLYTTPPTSDATVVLGPLVTLSTSIGCCGPLAVDSLPDGTIIFMGSDLHLYNYDGVTFQDLTDQYDGMPNIQNFLSPDGTTVTATSNQAMSTIVVRYYPTKKQVWIIMGTLGSNVLVFDLRSKAWSVYSGGTYLSMACVAGPLRTSTSPYPYLLLTGNFVGAIHIQDNQGTSQSSATPTLNWSITFTGESADFIPRSLLLPITGTNLNSVITVQFGFDGGALGTAITISGICPILNRLTIPFKEDQAQKKPISLQIQIIQTGGSPMFIHPFYLSDEVMS